MLRGCLKSPEMSVCDRCRATSEGAPIALCPLKSMLPIFTWTPFHAATETFQTASQGWGKRSISQFLHVSRPTVARWIERFEAEHLAGLADKSRAPTVPARKVWLPLMIDVYHLQKRHPDAGRFRIWSLLARPDISERTVGRVMALNKHVYDDIPHVDKPDRTKPPGPHPYKATAPHEYWFI